MSNEQKLMRLINGFIEDNNNNITQGKWVKVHKDSEIEIGISKSKGRKAIANKQYHLEIVDSQLVIHDKNNEYQVISDAVQRDKIFEEMVNAIAEIIFTQYSSAANDTTKNGIFNSLSSFFTSSSSSSSSLQPAPAIPSLTPPQLEQLKALQAQASTLQTKLQEEEIKLAADVAARKIKQETLDTSTNIDAQTAGELFLAIRTLDKQIEEYKEQTRNTKRDLDLCKNKIKELNEVQEPILIDMIRRKSRPENLEGKVSAETIICSTHKDDGLTHILFKNFYGKEDKLREMFNPFIANYKLEKIGDNIPERNNRLDDFLIIIDANQREKLFQGLQLSSGHPLENQDPLAKWGLTAKC